jgi:hypothetical protein
MKQLFTLLLLASGLFAKSTTTTTTLPANHGAIKTFEATYGKNTSANWTCTPLGCQVAFEHKGQHITALYSAAGTLRWYKKHIVSTELPVSLQMSLKNRFAGFWISDVEEKSGRTGATYVLTLENGFKKITLNAIGGKWQAVKTTTKA